MKLPAALTTIVFLVLISALIGAVWGLHELHTPVRIESAGEPFAVKRGDTFEQILRNLQIRGIIKHPLVLRIYLKLQHDNPAIMAGSYSLPLSASPLDIVQALKRGAPFDRITIIEGWNRFDIADALLRVKTLKLSGKKDAMRLLDDTRSIKDMDRGARNLEGYLFPDTYFLSGSSSAREVVSDMVHRFRQVWQTHLAKQAAGRGMSIHNAVVVASLVETEAKLEEERPIIASVIVNRLKLGMPLSVDSTIVYASKMAGAWRNDGKVYQSDIDRVSPYNTRKHRGLPPGPVGSPGLSCLLAAVNPATTDYLFYVRDPDRDDGAHHFYSDERGFATGVAALRAWEQQHK